jgi:hypothetical protein
MSALELASDVLDSSTEILLTVRRWSITSLAERTMSE